ncbi:hypothetical protein HTZ85_23000 [Escherichia coli]|nr:hypothetical protein [Escherichia coli]
MIGGKFEKEDSCGIAGTAPISGSVLRKYFPQGMYQFRGTGNVWRM